MQYLGGKYYTRKAIGSYLASIRQGRDYIEPFVGAAWILSEIQGGVRIASDQSLDLILLWQGIQNGWDPPSDLSKEQYENLRKESPSALRAFAGFGCSYSGKWFGGYAKPNSKNPNYARNTRNSLLRKKELIKNVTFLHCCFSEYDSSIEDSLIYCDPPYYNTTGYQFSFDTHKFWEWARLMSRKNKVIVSEYQAPSDFECVLEINTKTALKGSDTSRVEKLFTFKK